MTTDAEIGEYLAKLRDKAGLKQNELAQKITWSAAVLSRVESGERSVSPDELNSILEAIGSQEALNFRETAGRVWVNLPRPPLGHPDEALLWEAEKALQSIGELSATPEIKHAFVKRLEEYKAELADAARAVQRTEHSIAFVGNIGVGKSTALCRIAALEVQSERTAVPTPVLEVGGGGVTICEVDLVQGPRYGVVIEPRSEEELRREVLEFAHFLMLPPQTSQDEEANDQDSYGISREIERAIRNMSGLTVKREKGPDGGNVRVDSAKKLAETSTDPKALAVEILARMDLQKRIRRDLWFSETSRKEPLQWLKDIFEQINNGRHPEFSLPKRIEIMVPQRILGEESLSLRLVDTKGIDRTAERADIEDHFNRPNTVVVLCSTFNDAPSTSAQQLLERAVRGRFANLQAKASILVLPRPIEALAVKDDQGFLAETVSDGYELKGEQAEMRLKALGVPGVRIGFFNAREDEPDRLRVFLLELVGGLRKRHREHLEEVVAGANALVRNFEEEQVQEIQREAARQLIIWLQHNAQLGPIAAHLHDSLIQAVSTAHPSSVRASVRRQGEWPNLEYPHQLGYGARVMAAAAVGPKVEEFKALTTHLLQDPHLEEAFDLVRQAVRILEAGSDDLLQKSQLLGRATHTQDLRPDVPFWIRCDSEWGRGHGYRDRVRGHNQAWFDDASHAIHQSAVRALVEREWNQTLDRLAAILQV